MDPASFAAAFLFSQEPVTQQKLTVSPSAVIAAPAEVELEPAPTPPRPVQDEPAPDVPPGPIAVPEGNQGRSEKEQKEPESKIEAITKNARQVEKPKPSIPFGPQSPPAWRLTDRFGVTWTHPDKYYLERFVLGRNLTIAIPQLSSSRTYYSLPSCANGRCSW